MADPNPFEFGFPVGGVNKATALADQPNETTPSSLNVWPYDYPDGRMRGGVRPGLTSAGFPGADPYNWCPVTWTGGDGVAVTTSSGTYVTENGSTWNLRINTNPSIGSTGIASCGVLNGILYQASSTSATIRTYPLAGGSASTLAATAGTVPTNCGLAIGHMGRLFLAGGFLPSDPTINGNTLFASAVNDPTNWDVSNPDEGAAWASSGSSGQIGRTIIALLSHGNGCLLLGHLDAMTVVRGDPQIGGDIVEVDSFAGPVMNSAWCKLGDDSTAILTREELAIMPPGCGAPKTTLSRYKLPHDLAAVNPAGGDTAALAYDGRWNGLMIFIRRKVSEVEFSYSQFYFDLAHKGFSPMEFTSGEFRLGVTLSKALTRTRGSVIALKNGGGSYFDTNSSENINSHVVIGPIRMGNAILDGILTRIAFELSEDSDPVNFQIYGGSSAQEALNGPVRYSGTLTRKGLSYSFHPRIVGQVAWVKLYATGTARWAIERVVGESYPKSRRRVRYDAL